MPLRLIKMDSTQVSHLLNFLEFRRLGVWTLLNFIRHQGFRELFDVDIEQALFHGLLHCLLASSLMGLEELADGFLGGLVVAKGYVVDDAIAEVPTLVVKEGIGITASASCGGAFNMAHLEGNLRQDADKTVEVLPAVFHHIAEDETVAVIGIVPGKGVGGDVVFFLHGNSRIGRDGVADGGCLFFDGAFVALLIIVACMACGCSQNKGG